MSKSPPRLGRGLDAIFGQKPPIPAGPATLPTSAESPVREIDVAAVRPNPRQPRTQFDAVALEALAASIRVRGVLQPIIVRGLPDGAFELVAGERRLRAAKLAGRRAIPAIVRPISDGDSLEIALIENIQREDLNAVERAAAYQSYLDAFGVSSEQLAVRLGESRATVANHVRLLRLPPEVIEIVKSGALNMGHARALLAIDDPQRLVGAARLAVRRGLSVRQVEALAKSAAAATEPAASRGAVRHMADLDRQFSKALGVPVRVRAGKKRNSGRILISFANLDEFDRISERLGVARAAE